LWAVCTLFSRQKLSTQECTQAHTHIQVWAASWPKFYRKFCQNSIRIQTKIGQNFGQNGNSLRILANFPENLLENFPKFEFLSKFGQISGKIAEISPWFWDLFVKVLSEFR
jgi:hypothetical protein